MQSRLRLRQVGWYNPQGEQDVHSLKKINQSIKSRVVKKSAKNAQIAKRLKKVLVDQKRLYHGANCPTLAKRRAG
jgi:ethanolamine utilization protein EutQ (cupin superfamily)